MAGKSNEQKEPALETFVPSDNFRGYPDGVTPVDFEAGVESIPVTAEYAALIRAKGLAPDKKTPPSVVSTLSR